MKIIYINENRIPEIKRLIDESTEKISFLLFFEQIRDFIKGLLEDPINTKPSQILRDRGLHNGKLRKMLRDANIIKMSEKIDEPHSEETGEIESRYYISYKVPKKDFKKKVRRLYQKIFESGITENITRGEIDMMLNSPLTMGIVSDEKQPEYIKQAVDIYNEKIKNNKEKLNR